MTVRYLFAIATAILISSCQSQSQSIRGELFDISTNQDKFLCVLKDEDEAYSDGNLFVYSIGQRQSSTVSRIKNVHYQVRSFFLDDSRIIVFTMDEVKLYEIQKN